MRISVDDISHVFLKIIDFYKSHDIDYLDFNVNFYLKFLPEDWDKIDCESISPAMGSIDDDIASLKESLENDLFTTLDIERIAAILYGSVTILEPK